MVLLLTDRTMPPHSTVREKNNDHMVAESGIDIVTRPFFRRMGMEMASLRHNLSALTAAILAALTVLFVSTVAMACDVAVEPGMTTMSMTADSPPCESQPDQFSCQRACLIFCQGLIPPAASSAVSRLYRSIPYPSLEAGLADFIYEADDPPPRP
jgi:hypothetical protein